MLSGSLPVAFLLLALSLPFMNLGANAADTCTAKFNDLAYPYVSTTSCPDRSTIRCVACNSTTTSIATSGRYVLPQGGRCNSTITTDGAVCKANSVTPVQCCNSCAANKKCNYWQHYVPINPSCGQCGICWLYLNTRPALPTCVTSSVCNRLNTNASMVGKQNCPSTVNDPHFKGAHGTKFEFNGIPDQSFCLVTSEAFQVNMKMRGYLDTRTVGATVLKSGKAIRSWIKEMGFIWKSSTGREHSFRLVARDGKSQTRGKGFLSLIEFDGQALNMLDIGESYNLKGGLKFTFMGREKQGGGFFDVDVFNLKIRKYLNVDIKLRIAHPLLQTADDAQTHINIHFNHVASSNNIHGVMGQTYRQGREQRAMDYSALSGLLGTPIAADGPTGRGFLDGEAKDYRTSSVLATDCVYTAYDGHKLPKVNDLTGHEAAFSKLTSA